MVKREKRHDKVTQRCESESEEMPKKGFIKSQKSLGVPGLFIKGLTDVGSRRDLWVVPSSPALGSALGMELASLPPSLK